MAVLSHVIWSLFSGKRDLTFISTGKRDLVFISTGMRDRTPSLPPHILTFRAMFVIFNNIILFLATFCVLVLHEGLQQWTNSSYPQTRSRRPLACTWAEFLIKKTSGLSVWTMRSLLKTLKTCSRNKKTKNLYFWKRVSFFSVDQKNILCGVHITLADFRLVELWLSLLFFFNDFVFF